MARFVYFNPNPFGAKTGDCVIRAICAATGQDWDTVYAGVVFAGYAAKDMPSSNSVWGDYLRSLGFIRRIIPNTCPRCYTVGDFADDHPEGRYILGTGTHAVAVVDGAILDSWDSRYEVPDYYFTEVSKYGV